MAKNKTTNNLCSVWEQDRGFDMFDSGFGFMIFKDCKRWVEVSTQSEGHDIIREEVNDMDDWGFNDGSTMGTTSPPK